jgi:hypothetical protein
MSINVQLVKIKLSRSTKLKDHFKIIVNVLAYRSRPGSHDTQHRDTKQNNGEHTITNIFLWNYAKCLYVSSRYTDCHYAECLCVLLNVALLSPVILNGVTLSVIMLGNITLSNVKFRAPPHSA